MATDGSIRLPEIATPDTPATDKHRIFVGTDGNLKKVDDLGAVVTYTAGGSNAFVTMVPTTGTNAVADSSTDILTFASADGSVAIAGNGTTDTLDFSVVGKQASDATLTALAAFNTNGFLVQTAADTFAGRSLTEPAAGITIANNAGVAGNAIFALANDLAALEGLATTGLAARNATDAWVTRTITAPAAGITVSNGDGVSGNPTLALANDLSAVEGLASNGIAVRTGTDTWAARNIAVNTNHLSVTNADGVSGNPTVAMNANQTFGSFGITFDNAAVNTARYISIPYNCTISEWTMIGNTSGNVAVNIWKTTYALAPPVAANSIVANNTMPRLVSEAKNTSTNTSGWTLTVAAGDVVAFNLDSSSGVNSATLVVKVIK